VTVRTIFTLPWALVAYPADDLLAQREWTGLAGVVSAMVPNAACEDYDWELQRIAERGQYFDKGHISRKITHDPERFLGALRKLGQPTLASAFLDVWPEAGT
jgi:hypothetical protein